MPYDNTNRGSLWRLTDEQKAAHRLDNPPDYEGSQDVDGVMYFMDGWVQECGPNTKTPGKKFLSTRVKRKNTQPADQPAERTPPAPAGGFDDEIPFGAVEHH